ncbi:hypothetical protein CANCADRAFT_20452, partial [Tortispora caseinolytica NRRL Y-17796]
IDADSLVSLMLITVVKANMKHYASYLFMMKELNTTDVSSGHAGYALATFEAVLMYAQAAHDTLLEISHANEVFWNYCSTNFDLTLFQSRVQFNEKLSLNVTSDESWLSILLSKDANDETALVKYLADSRNAEFVQLFDHLCKLSSDYVLNDTDVNGATLLSLAVKSENHAVAFHISDYLLTLDSSSVIEYLRISDKWGRTPAHYFFAIPALIDKLGIFVDWNYKDAKGQTALMALCRSYD